MENLHLQTFPIVILLKFLYSSSEIPVLTLPICSRIKVDNTILEQKNLLIEAAAHNPYCLYPLHLHDENYHN
jgi:hypothetical protein